MAIGTATQARKLTGVRLAGPGPAELADGSKTTLTAVDFRQAAANFARLSIGATPLHLVPLVLGGENGRQEEGRAAAGWLAALTWDGTQLVGSFSDVAPWAAAGIASDGYSRIGVELDNFVDNEGRDYGMAVRRVFVEGLRLPQSWAPGLAGKFFADRSKVKVVTRIVTRRPSAGKFSETLTMTREQILAFLQEAGIKATDVESLPDAVLDSIAVAIRNAHAQPSAEMAQKFAELEGMARAAFAAIGRQPSNGRGLPAHAQKQTPEQIKAKAKQFAERRNKATRAASSAV